MNLARQFDHPNIIRYFASKDDSTHRSPDGNAVSVAYIVQELIPGVELFDFIKTNGPIPEEQCKHYFKQMLQGLNHIHMSGYCHRDLKPENILLTNEGTVKIIDFGFATSLVGCGNGFIEGGIVGTPNYIDPKILEGRPYKGAPVDVYALGVILYIMVTKEFPFK